MDLGFIGTGQITSAIVTGLCTCENGCNHNNILVSPRNKEKSAALAKTYDGVHVAKNNQEVVDNCDMVFLAVLPQHKEKILTPLHFRRDQMVVHILAATQLEEIKPLVSPATQIVRAVPLPCAAIHAGPVALYPAEGEASHTVAKLFSRLGSVIPLDEESQLDTLAVITALMAPYYAIVEKITAWAQVQGILRKDAAAYIASMFEALSRIAQSAHDGDAGRLARECMTSGGLNELAMQVIEEKGGFENFQTALDAVKNRQ
jgi:pyrroline-5-carboxylate reductase